MRAWTCLLEPAFLRFLSTSISLVFLTKARKHTVQVLFAEASKYNHESYA